MGWYGVDLDGTLAKWEMGDKIDDIGEPVSIMLDRVKRWLAEGKEVRIVTARVAMTGQYVAQSGRVDNREFALSQVELIERWCRQHLGTPLAVTASKDFSMIELWDDRCVQVEMNTGRRMDGQESGFIFTDKRK